MTYIKRIYQTDLLGFSINGHPCEKCYSHMHAHEWVDLDENGFAVHCSNAEAGLTEVFVFIEGDST